MWGHVSEEALIDLLDGAADDAARAHVESCPRCRERFETARAGLLAAADADVPEPAPQFWTAFQRQVDHRLGKDRPRVILGLRPALLALAALVAFVSLVPLTQKPGPSPEPVLPKWSALPPLAEDSGFSVLQALDVEDDDLALSSDSSGVAGLVAGLSEAESLELAAALAGELAGRYTGTPTS